MRLIRQSSGEPVLLDPRTRLGAGGEARVFALAQESALCAKIYHHPTEAQIRKLSVMVANPPTDPMASQGHISIAWPVDLLRTVYGGQQFAGFLMPRVTGMRPLFHIYNPVTRRKESPRFDYRYLHRAARNVVRSVRALHGCGYLVGDINESNILVSETALVTLVDTDSFQVRDPDSDRVYRCPVGKPDYTPPELQNKNFRLVDRQPEHDLFGLAVLIFQLLMEGAHPYSGIYTPGGDPPPYETRILAGHFPYGTRDTPYRPMPLAPPIGLLHPQLAALFLRCFEAGHREPAMRPSCVEWSAALQEAEDALIGCADNPQHWYGAHLGSCPWCLRTELLGGRDPFPPEAQEPIRRPARPIPAATRPTAVAPRTAVASAPPPPVSAPNPNLPQWPLAPSAMPSGSASGGAPPATIPIPPYPGATWVAGCLAVLAVLLPGFRFLSGLLALICGVMGWRQARAGRPLAATSAAIGVTAMIVLTVSAIGRSVIKAPERSVTLNGPIRAIAFSPDSSSVVTATERNEDQRLITGQIAFYNAVTGDLQHTMVGTGDMTALAYSPDGRTLATGTGALMETGRVRLLNAGTGAERVELPDFRGDVESIAFTPDSTRVVTGSRDGQVRVWDTASGRLMRRMTAQGEVFGVAVSPDSRLVAAGSGSSGSGLPGYVAVWDLASGRPIWAQKAHSERAESVAFAQKGAILLSAGNDNTVRIWDPNSGRRERMLEVRGVQSLNALAVSPDGDHLITGSNDGITRMWDLQSGQVVRSFIPDASERSGEDLLVAAVAYSPNGEFIASGGRGGTFHIWRLR